MIIVFVFVVLSASIVGSISGIGGGVIIKPVMDAIFDLTTTQISFLNGTTVLTMTAVSLIKGRSELKINPQILMLSIGGAIGGILGKQLFRIIKENTANEFYLGFIQNIFMVLITLIVFIYVLNKAKITTKEFKSLFFSLAVGLFLGLISAFLGIGGGPINIMILSYLFSFDTKDAALMSLFIIFFSQIFSLVTSFITRTIPSFDLSLLFIMMFCAVIGSLVGRKISQKMDDKAVDRLFLCLMILIISLSLFNCYKFFCLI